MAPRVTKTEPETLTYLLRDIDPDLWARVGERAKREGMPIRSMLLFFARHYADGGIITLGTGVAPATGKRAKRPRR